MQEAVQQFLVKHLASKAPKSVPEKIKYWILVANETATVYPDAGPDELKRRRRNARNNVRRLATKHAVLLPEIERELEPQETGR